MRHLVLSFTIASVVLVGALALAQAQAPNEPVGEVATTNGTALGYQVAVSDATQKRIITNPTMGLQMPLGTQALAETLPLTYTLQIEDPATGVAQVEIVYSHPPTNQVQLGLGQHGIPTITDFNAVDENGSSLPVTDLGAVQGFGSVMQITVGGATIVSVTYGVDLNASSSGNILNTTYGAVEPEYTFYRPVETYDGPIAFRLDLPPGWPAVTIYEGDSGVYHTPSIDDFIWTPIVFGAFHTSTHVSDNVTMTIAFQDGVSNTLELDIYDAVTRIFDYLTLTIGDLSVSQKLPRTSYLLVYLPQELSKVSAREYAFGYTVNANSLDAPYWGEIPGSTYVGWQAHMIGHAWQGGAFEAPFWFFEGINTFYQYRTVRETGLRTNEQYQTVMVSLYQWYVDHILGTEDDISLVDASQYNGPFDPEIFRINYWKAALVGHILNETLASVTGGVVNFDDVMHHLYQQYVVKSSAYVSEETMLETTNYLSGHDFSGFFDAYIYGNDPLPCHVEREELVIDFEAMPDIPQLSTGTIQGYVYEQDSVTPVDNVCVNVSSTAPDWNQAADFCCTDAAGAFTITNVPVGDVYVKTHANCQDAHPNLIDEWYAEGGSTPDGNLATPVEVITGQTTSGIDFALDLAGSISGHVFEADGVTVITDTLISVHAHGITPDSSSLGTWVSQTDGSYAVTGLAPGTYKVQANNNLVPGYVTKYYDDKLTWDEADTIEILAGQVVTGIDFTLEEAGTVTGYVYEEDGSTPVENACVNVSLTAPEWTQVTGWCCTDENGSYSINSLPVGSYYLRTHADCNGAHPDLIDEWYAEGGSTPNGNQADPVQVFAGQTVSGVNFTLNRITSVELDYVLTIDDPGSGQATVTMTVGNLSTSVFEVEEHGYHGLYINVLALSVYDTNGNLLAVEHLPDSGSTYFDRQADVWRVQCTGLSQILVEYTVQPDGINYGDRHQGYIAPDFAAMAGEYAFLVPRGAIADSITVSFNLPIGWLVYTPWTQQKDGYNPALSGADVIDSLSISSFALGHFDVFTQTVGATEVAVAVYAGWPAVMKEELAQGSWDVFAYLTSVFDTSVGDYYLLIYCPVAPDGRIISVGEWSNSGGYSIRVKDDGSYWGEWDGLSHQLFHRWNCWPPWGIHGYYGWFVEGPDVLYEMKTVTELRFEWPYGNIIEDPLHWYYDRYLEDYVATGNDRPLTSQDLDDFLIYRKGAMVAFLLAKEIYLRTDGAHNFDDFLQALVQKYGHHVAPCSEECLKAELAILTGTDFTQFFDDYVYGTTTLPMDWAFEDDDGDELSNALEVGWDTHPEDEDTDGDGYSDGAEVAAGSDPLYPSSVPPPPYITKSVIPEGQVNYGDELTYTLVISTVPGVQIGLYDPLEGTTFTRFVEQPPGVSHTEGVITGTLTVTPSNRITVSFVTQVGVPGTAGWIVDATNRACVYPFGGTLGVCTWSDEVTNPAFRPYNVYLPIALRDH